MAETAKEIVVDPGLDETIKKLTPKKIENTINKVLTRGAAARLKVYMQTWFTVAYVQRRAIFTSPMTRTPVFRLWAK